MNSPKSLPILSVTLFLALAVASSCRADSDSKIQQYSYVTLEARPLNADIFVQGAEIVNDSLFLSGGGYGESAIYEYSFSDGELLNKKLVNSKFFAEGITVFNDLLYLLTWRSKMAFSYRVDGLVPMQWFRLPGEGWGITHNDSELIYSDGSDRLFFVAPDRFEITRSLRVTENGKPLKWLNELEWIQGYIWANVWKSDRIVIIDPSTGTVVGNVDFSNLLPPADRTRHSEVLNGIAFDNISNSLWITGKRWPKIYKVALCPQQETSALDIGITLACTNTGVPKTPQSNQTRPAIPRPR